MKGQTKNFYAYIRHGERADMIDHKNENQNPQKYVFSRNLENPIDVPLTKEGIL